MVASTLFIVLFGAGDLNDCESKGDSLLGFQILSLNWDRNDNRTNY